MRFSVIFLSLLSSLAAVESTKSGIDISLSGTQGVDWDQEFFFHDTAINDRSVIYLKQATAITLSHNARNVSYAGSGEYTAVSGGNNGTILYKVDRDLQWGPSWGDAGANETFYTFAGGTQSIANFNNTTYSAPFALADLTYDGSTAVVGTTGGSGTITNWGTYYYRGILDSVGDEWHTLTVADYDSFVGDSEGKASDGKVFLLVVNPKTPILTVAVTGDAQFYTTPAKVYFVPKVHDQTTYINAGTGSVTVTLKDINGGNIFWRLGGSGAFTDAGSSTKTFTATDFSTGTNLLDYYYAGNAAYTKRRTIVKNPSFPSAGETHGELFLGGSTRQAAISARLSRAPYQYSYGHTFANDTNNPISTWEATLYRSKKRTVYGQFAAKNAFAAAFRGWTSTPTGFSTTSAQFAKQMLLDNERNIDPVGQELNQAGRAIPARELFYRGYYDMRATISLAFAYDLLIANFKSTDQTGGITAIEDYFIRDLLAGCVMDAMFIEGCFGGQQYPNTGMWGTARNIGALMIAKVMPSYSTAYYGTSGFDGNTTTYAWTPFPDFPLTWKTVFLDNNATLRGYPNLHFRFGVEDYEWPVEGYYGDLIDYLNQGNMGWIYMVFSSWAKLNGYTSNYPRLDAGLAKLSLGILRGSDSNGEIPLDLYDAAPAGGILASNQYHPTMYAQFMANQAQHTSGDGTYEHPLGNSSNVSNPWFLIYYEDDFTPASPRRTKPAGASLLLRRR